MQKTTQFSRLHTPINKSYHTTYQTYRYSQNTKKYIKHSFIEKYFVSLHRFSINK